MYPTTLHSALLTCFEHGSAARYGGADISVTLDGHTIECDEFEAIYFDQKDSFVGSVAAHQRWCESMGYLFKIAEQDARETNPTYWEGESIEGFERPSP